MIHPLHTSISEVLHLTQPYIALRVLAYTLTSE